MHASVRGFVASVAVFLLAACSDSTTGPRQIAPHSPSAPAFDFTATGAALGWFQSDFAVGPTGGSFSIGGLYTVNFPANSVCDPSQSTYGPSEWDKSCIVLGDGQAVKVHATLSLSSGGLAVDFSPPLRFSPKTQVTISTDIFASIIKSNRDYFTNHPDALNAVAIFYSSGLGLSGVSDFAADPSVITHVDLNTGRIWRRVKHFSGYSIVSGESCDPSPDNPDCVEIDGVGR
jgi:hypothetical protein